MCLLIFLQTDSAWAETATILFMLYTVGGGVKGQHTSQLTSRKRNGTTAREFRILGFSSHSVISYKDILGLVMWPVIPKEGEMLKGMEIRESSGCEVGLLSPAAVSSVHLANVASVQSMK